MIVVRVKGCVLCSDGGDDGRLGVIVVRVKEGVCSVVMVMRREWVW